MALCTEGLAFLFELPENERGFLDGVHDRGEVNANLLGVEREVGARIAAMPMLAWKCKHVRRRRGLEPWEKAGESGGGHPPNHQRHHGVVPAFVDLARAT